jgi:hypothetical protein
MSVMSAFAGNVSFPDVGDSSSAMVGLLARAVGGLSVWAVLVTLLAVAVVYDQSTFVLAALRGR